MSKDKVDHICNLHILSKEGFLFCLARNRIWQQGKFRVLLHLSWAFKFLEGSRFCHISWLSERCQVLMFSLAQIKGLEAEVHSVPHKKLIMSLGLWKKQLLHSLRVLSGSSHLLITEQRWVLHPYSSTNPGNRFLFFTTKLVLFVEECLSTVDERNDDKNTACHNNVVSPFAWIQTALSSALVWKGWPPSWQKMCFDPMFAQQLTQQSQSANGTSNHIR